MKVICIDNFNREHISDTLFRDNLSEQEAMDIAKEQNRKQGEFGDKYFRAVGDDYKLYRFEP